MTTVRVLVAAVATAALLTAAWPSAPAMANGGAACDCCAAGARPAGMACEACQTPAGQSGHHRAPAKGSDRCGCTVAPVATATAEVVLIVPVGVLLVIPPALGRAPLGAPVDLSRPPIR